MVQENKETRQEQREQHRYGKALETLAKTLDQCAERKLVDNIHQTSMIRFSFLTIKGSLKLPRSPLKEPKLITIKPAMAGSVDKEVAKDLRS
ncbi:MAG: hypothetical protein IJS04_07850 [Muribaculaceae bacterium]|nr:hypothetical protein [Muribaculaceae bacterium]MBQ7205737.1 hypothetical protein [Muribaculaceae bacterium]